MAKLLILAACERVIIDQKQVPSLVSIFQNIEFSVNVPMPENALAPFRWYVFALWRHTPDEAGKTFTQRISVISPNGVEFAKAEAAYTLAADDLYGKNTTEIFGVPIAHAGEMSVNVYLNDEAEPRGSYFFTVRHQKKESSTN